MPTYEYTCTDCGSTTDVRATLAEKQAGLVPRCASCGGRDLRRAFSTLAVIGGSAAGQAQPAAGGCCGGACGCG